LAAGWERARKAAATSADLGERSEQSIHREGTCFSVPDRRRSKRLQSAIRARDVRAADLQEEPTKPVEDRAVLVDGRFVGSDEDGGSPANIERAERAIGHSERQRAEQSNTSTAVDSSEKLVDDLGCDPFVVKVRARYIPPSHGTVQSDQPRDTIPPKITRPEVARVVHRPRVVCSSAVRS
jgi:hypothetical protein